MYIDDLHEYYHVKEELRYVPTRRAAAIIAANRDVRPHRDRSAVDSAFVRSRSFSSRDFAPHHTAADCVGLCLRLRTAQHDACDAAENPLCGCHSWAVDGAGF